MRVPSDMLVRRSIRAAAITRRTVMQVRVTMVVLPITTEAVATIMEDRIIRTTGTIRRGHLRPTDITHMHLTGVIRIHTIGVIQAVTRTTSRGMVTTMQRLQPYSTAWVSLATTPA